MEAVEGGKRELRARMMAVRKAIPEAERKAMDEAIRAHVNASEAFGEASVVFAYLSMGTEVDTRGIIKDAWRAGKVVAIPRCVGPRCMRWFRIVDFEGLEKSSLGVEEPIVDDAAEQLTTGEGMVALVPGLAFDGCGYRLGYGGGFYDTFLVDFEGASIGLCRSVQLMDDLNRLGVIGEYDLPVDVVMSDAGPVGGRAL